jgi:hypothetical protein
MRAGEKKRKRRSVKKQSRVPKKPAGRVVLLEKGGDMSNRIRRELKNLKDTMAQHSRTVEQRLAKTGTAPRISLVASASKYYPTLKKLAER